MEITREYILTHFAVGSDVREAYDAIAPTDRDATTLSLDKFERVPTDVARRFSDHHGDGALTVLRGLLREPAPSAALNGLTSERWLCMTPSQRSVLLRTAMTEEPDTQRALLNVLNAAYAQLVASDSSPVSERVAGAWYLGFPIALVVRAPPPGPLPSAFYRGRESGTFRYLPARLTGEMTAAVSGGITTASFESFLEHALTHIRRLGADVIAVTDHGAPGVQTFGESGDVLSSGGLAVPPEFRLRQLALLAPLFAPSGTFELGGCEVGAQTAGQALLTRISRALAGITVEAGLIPQLPWLPGFEGSVRVCRTESQVTHCVID